MCYWYQQTKANYANSEMAKSEAEAEALAKRTIDFVAPGEQQSEAGHEGIYSSDTNTGLFNSERYRDARNGGFIQYTLANIDSNAKNLSIMMRFSRADRGRKASVTVNGQVIATFTIEGSREGGFYNLEFPIPAEIVQAVQANNNIYKVRLTADPSSLCPGLYYLRLLK